MFLQSFVTPVCLYSKQGEHAHVEELMGSAFFVNSNGIFITARHVAESAFERVQDKGWIFSLAVKDKQGTHKKSMLAEVVQIENAPSPYDIAIGRVNYQCNQRFVCRNEK